MSRQEIIRDDSFSFDLTNFLIAADMINYMFDIITTFTQSNLLSDF